MRLEIKIPYSSDQILKIEKILSLNKVIKNIIQIELLIVFILTI